MYGEVNPSFLICSIFVFSSLLNFFSRRIGTKPTSKNDMNKKKECVRFFLILPQNSPFQHPQRRLIGSPANTAHMPTKKTKKTKSYNYIYTPSSPPSLRIQKNYPLPPIHTPSPLPPPITSTSKPHPQNYPDTHTSPSPSSPW